VDIQELTGPASAARCPASLARKLELFPNVFRGGLAKGPGKSPKYEYLQELFRNVFR